MPTVNTSDERLPFWLVALVAGATTFVLVAVLAVLVIRPWWKRPPPPPAFSPQMRAIQGALNAQGIRVGSDGIVEVTVMGTPARPLVRSGGGQPQRGR